MYGYSITFANEWHNNVVIDEFQTLVISMIFFQD